MRTEAEIKTKYEELNARMRELMPNENDVTELRDTLTGGPSVESLQKVLKRSHHTISTDAQRYILEWVLGDNK